MSGFLKGGKFNKPVITEKKPETPVVPATGTMPSAFKRKLGTLNKKEEIVKEEEKVENVVEETTVPKELDIDKQSEILNKEETTPKLFTKKKLGGLKKKEEVKEEIVEEVKPIEEPKTETAKESVEEPIVATEPTEITEEIEENIKEEETHIEQTIEDNKTKVKEDKKKVSSNKKKTTRKKTVTTEDSGLIAPEVDESRRVSIDDMDAIMRPIVAPTTALWEQEKKDILDVLNNIRVEQDMTMAQVKNALAELDDLKFEVLPKQHDAETLYDGTKQNYDTVKAIAIAKGSGTNAEARKAEGILACQNYVTPSGDVVDLHQYMLLIEEKNKFYQKIVEGINFKKYSLVNYNNALKIESKDL